VQRTSRPARVEFRQAGIADLDCLYRMEQRSYPHPWSRKQFADELTVENGFVEIIEYDQQLAGYCCCRLVDVDLEILNIAIDPLLRQRGLGQSLLQRVLSEARRKGVEQVLLEVRAGNQAARELYLRNRFTEVGRRRGYYRDGEDALLFTFYCHCQVKEKE